MITRKGYANPGLKNIKLFFFKIFLLKNDLLFVIIIIKENLNNFNISSVSPVQPIKYESRSHYNTDRSVNIIQIIRE